MPSRNYTPLMVTLAIALLLAIVWLGSRAQKPVYRMSSKSAPYATTQPPADTSTSGDPLITPGPSRMY